MPDHHPEDTAMANPPDLARYLAGEKITLRDMQAFHRALDQVKGFDTDLMRNIVYLVGELGEVVHAIRRWQQEQDTSAAGQAAEDLGHELADCLAYLVKLANYCDVDLQAAYMAKMRHNLSRTWPARRAQTNREPT